MKRTIYLLILGLSFLAIATEVARAWDTGGWSTYNINVDGTIYNSGINVVSGNYVCYNSTTKAFYVKSACP